MHDFNRHTQVHGGASSYPSRFVHNQFFFFQIIQLLPQCHCMKIHRTGADIVNDVSAGVFDPLMVSTVGSLGVPYIAMHMRGDPLTMTQPQHLNYSTSMATDNNAAEHAIGSTSFGVVSGVAFSAAAEQCKSTEAKNEDNVIVTIVAHELQQRFNEIDRHIPRWLQWVDPGIGFAKGYEENLALLQPYNLRRFKQLLGGRFMVVGFSRKKFLSRIVEESLAQRRQLGYEIDADVVSREEHEVPGSSVAPVVTIEDRDLASAAGCAAILQGQADMVRVHNVAATRIICDTFQAFQTYK